MLDVYLRFCHALRRDNAASNRFRHVFGPCGSVPTGGAEKRFLINRLDRREARLDKKQKLAILDEALKLNPEKNTLKRIEKAIESIKK